MKNSFFTFAHTQYLIPNAYSVGMVVSLLTLAVGFGIVFAWTRSLIPSIIAHAIINLLMTPVWQAALLVAFMVGVYVSWPRGIATFRHVFSNASAAACVILAFAGAAWAIMAVRDEPAVYVVAVGAVIIAIGLEAMDRRRTRIATKSPISA